jgi:Tol biopolymer transport system component
MVRHDCTEMMTMPTRLKRTAVAAVAAVAMAATGCPGLTPVGAAAQIVLARVSQATGGQGGNGLSRQPVPDSDGSVVAFDSFASDLVAGDTNATFDVFVDDRATGTTTRVSLSSAGAQGNGLSEDASVSDDGNLVAFTSTASNLVTGDTNGAADVFVRDRAAGTTTRVSVSTGGAEGLGVSGTPSISGDGRFVAFSSGAANLVTGDSDGVTDVFVRDRVASTTELVSRPSGTSSLANGASTAPAVSGDGAKVAFQSVATNLAAGDTNAVSDVFVRDRSGTTTTRASVADDETQADGPSSAPAISADGATVAFASDATDLVGGADTNGSTDVFVRRLTPATTTRVSVTTGGAQVTGRSFGPSISGDAASVAFVSSAPDVVPGDTNGANDAFVRDGSATVRRASAPPAGGPGNGPVTSPSAVVSTNGDAVAFASAATDLVTGDTNASADAFVSDQGVRTGPFSTFEAFIRQQYVDFDGRQPTGSELSSGLNQLRSGTVSPADLISTRAHDGWAVHRAPVMRLYLAVFLRAPDTGGLNYWVDQYTKGKALATIAEAFARSSEFVHRYGSLTNDQFVTLVYQNVLGRDPDSGGRTYWNQRLASGLTRGGMMVGFSESSEYKRVTGPEIDTLLVYSGMLRVAPPADVYAAWVTDLRNGTPLTDRITVLLNSGQYSARF